MKTAMQDDAPYEGGHLNVCWWYNVIARKEATTCQYYEINSNVQLYIYLGFAYFIYILPHLKDLKLATILHKNPSQLIQSSSPSHFWLLKASWNKTGLFVLYILLWKDAHSDFGKGGGGVWKHHSHSRWSNQKPSSCMSLHSTSCSDGKLKRTFLKLMIQQGWRSLIK